MTDLITDFQIKMPHWVKAMKLANHHYEKNGEVVSINPYHREGDCWSHTQMVCLLAELEQASKLVKYATLLHDIGKPLARESKEDKQRVAFIGHEGLSSLMAREYLDQCELSDAEKIYIIKLISLHTVVFHMMEGEDWEWKVAEKFVGQADLLRDLLVLGYCDARGRFMEKEFEYSLTELLAKFEFVFEAIKELEVKSKATYVKEVVILIGPPNAGKSTYLSKNAGSDLVICRDDVITSMFPNLTYDEAYRKADSSVVDKKFNDLVQQAVKDKVDRVYFDLTNMAPKSRRRCSGAFGKDYKVKMVVFLTAYETLMKRNKVRAQTGKSIPDFVMKDMMKRFLFPLADEADEIEVIY